MKIKEIDRFIYEDLEYHIEHTIFDYNGQNISLPYFQITTKSSRKKRTDFKSSKDDGHFQLVGLNNPFPLIRKIYSIMEEALKDFNHVCFWPHDDKSDKRGRVYIAFLNRMGFNILTKHPDHEWYFLSREKFKFKKKEVNIIQWAIYNELT